MFAIVQGACYPDLRKECAEFLSQHPFDGFALGGLAVGESRQEREDTVEFAASLLPENRPRYLMGVGTPIDLLEAVHRGMDMFDCIIPTQLAEQGVVFTSEGKLQLIRGSYKFSEDKLDKNCNCPTCAQYSRAYLHHLVKTCEPLSTQLLGAHNIYFYHQFMSLMRSSLENENFLNFYNQWKEILLLRDTTNYTKSLQPKVGRRPDRRPFQMGDYEIYKAPNKNFFIRHSNSGEIMHPGDDPQIEAQSLYLEQSKLIEKLYSTQSNEDIVLWDVGMGAAFNTMAVINSVEAAFKQKKFQSKLKMYCFENDLNPLNLALCHPAHFTHLRHKAPHSLLEKNSYFNDFLECHLLEGDFLETMNHAPPAQIIFFDPFSSKTNSTLWSLKCFQKIYAHCLGQKTELYNYTASTAIRSRMLLAGFFVAKGQATPPKLETTVACNYESINLHSKWLGIEWLHKLQRSDTHNKILPNGDWEKVFETIKNHPQFSS
jgi:queuine tRNA-ribosyltransferase